MLIATRWPQAGDGHVRPLDEARQAARPRARLDDPLGAGEKPEASQWLMWRRSAQGVTRAWNEWLAADSRQRVERFRCYLSALSAEEHAAVELERVLGMGGREQ